MSIYIVIPARFESKRFPGKPLKLLAGKTMLSRVVEVARASIVDVKDAKVLVATDDQRIIAHCQEIDVEVVDTPVSCVNGTDRVFTALEILKQKPDFVINFQGDAPLTPPWFVQAIIEEHKKNPEADVITPCVQLTWSELDALREHKKVSPFSGTTALLNSESQAIWFSKQIIPAIKKEKREEKFSPVFKHIGIYGYKFDALARYVKMPESEYEKIEELEQLRLLENGYKINIVKVSYNGRTPNAGIDSPEDLKIAEQIIASEGEFI